MLLPIKGSKKVKKINKVNNVHTATYVTEDIKDEIDRIALKYRVSRSQVLRTILRNIIEHKLVDKYME
jgi:antitoxin component of RelBE/YafQ-DinJ toxin-antitoxin module